MKNGIFITATGTDVGKTYISALILKRLIENGINAGYYKPVLSGAELCNGKLIPGDAKYVLTSAGLDVKPEDCVCYCFKEAVSPHLAAHLEGKSIRLNKIISDFNGLRQKYDYIVVEGAGGIVCPFGITDNKLMLDDVIKALGFDIIIVASAALGTINSTVLTVEYARMLGISVRGIILNNYNENDFMHRDNLKQIEYLTGVSVVATVRSGGKVLENFKL